MFYLAAINVSIVFAGILFYIWRLQYVFPDFALFLLAFLVLTFFIHRDSFEKLGFGSHGMAASMKLLLGPTLILAGFLLMAGFLTGVFENWTWNADKAASAFKYFSWCLFQQFGLQSFFTNRLLTIFPRRNHAAWVSATVFAIFHIPNPVLMPVTLFGGYILTRVFIAHRNLIPLAVSQAVIGMTLSLVIPAAWHHGLRVGPGYYKFH
jgi:CAAX prenyl protease-like protein